ncbi:MAG: ABC transporter permease [Bacteroidales bacterium]|nr:ABC transporter permease [Bacteroidales bacterium]MDD4669617.1 ABC transporter permease [Bacteroidales bacterium]
MNFKKINIIIGREYAVRVKKKSFILTTILTPILFALLVCIPSLIMIYGGGDAKKIKVVDDSAIVASHFENTDKVEYIVAADGENLENLKERFDTLDYYAIVGISKLDSNNNVAVRAYSKEPLNIDIKNSIAKVVNKSVEDYKLAQYNIENIDTILSDVKSNIKVEALTLKEGGTEKKESVEIYMILAYIMSFMIYGFVFMFGTMVMRGVIEEKSNRIIEVIVSSVKSFELMMGKIIGVALVALTQFFIWIGLTIVLVLVFNLAFGMDLTKGVSQDQMAQITQVTGANGVDISSVTGTSIDTLNIQSSEAIPAAESDSTFIQDAIQQLSQINFIYIIGCFLIYFILGYLLYAAMFAAVGSAVDNEADTNQLTLPITLPLIIGLFIMLSTFQDPSSPLSFWASIIPFTSPMVMMARIPFGVVPTWELLLSIGLLIITFVITVFIAGKIYRVGILMYGKKATFKDLFKWIKYKN